MSQEPTQRTSWFDEKSQSSLIDDYALKMSSYVQAMADGRIDERELKSQEARLLAVMKEVEPKLDDALHAKVTELLCELTVFDLMQTLNQMQQSRPKTVFRG